MLRVYRSVVIQPAGLRWRDLQAQWSWGQINDVYRWQGGKTRVVLLPATNLEELASLRAAVLMIQFFRAKRVIFTLLRWCSCPSSGSAVQKLMPIIISPHWDCTHIIPFFRWSTDSYETTLLGHASVQRQLPPSPCREPPDSSARWLEVVAQGKQRGKFAEWEVCEHRFVCWKTKYTVSCRNICRKSFIIFSKECISTGTSPDLCGIFPGTRAIIAMNRTPSEDTSGSFTPFVAVGRRKLF